MKRFNIFVISLLACICMSAQDTYRFRTGEFNKLYVLDNIDVVYDCNPDSTGYAWFEGSREMADCMRLTVKNGSLKVQAEPDFIGKKLPTLHVSSDFLSEITYSGTGEALVKTVAPCAEFKAVLIGNGSLIIDDIRATKVNAYLRTGRGSVVLHGECKDARLSMLGTGLIQADELQAEKVECVISGTGSIGCWATDYLKMKGMGSTTVYVKGDPKIKKSSLGGKIVKLHSEEDGDPQAENS